MFIVSISWFLYLVSRLGIIGYSINQFQCNPEITLHVNLDVSINAEEFPPLVNITKSPLLKGSSLEIGEKSWTKIVGQNLVNSKISHNDSSLLEC